MARPQKESIKHSFNFSTDAAAKLRVLSELHTKGSLTDVIEDLIQDEYRRKFQIIQSFWVLRGENPEHPSPRPGPSLKEEFLQI